MDGARIGVQPLTASARTVDLHLHSTASDGNLPPEDVVARAAGAGLAAIALTDHDTLGGVAAAEAAGARLGVKVIGGCEFSCAAPWGEMHVLGYFLPGSNAALDAFLASCRADRVRRARAIVDRLRRLGLDLTFDDVLQTSAGAAMGRPHVARVLARKGVVGSLSEAFDRYLGRGRPGFVDKVLPSFRDVARVAHSVGGLVSAAHLKDRASRPLLERFREEGLDALEIRHPSHSPDVRARLAQLASEIGLLQTGGSDWHGEREGSGEQHGTIGSEQVPEEWLLALEQRRAA